MSVENGSFGKWCKDKFWAFSIFRADTDGWQREQNKHINGLSNVLVHNEVQEQLQCSLADFFWLAKHHSSRRYSLIWIRNLCIAVQLGSDLMTVKTISYDSHTVHTHENMKSAPCMEESALCFSTHFPRFLLPFIS